jgi:hypothetical protein
MATINDDAQWIILIGFIVCLAIFFLGVVINESAIVGQTTAESVLEFSKSDIQDIRDEILRHIYLDGTSNQPQFNNTMATIENLSSKEKNAIVQITPDWTRKIVVIHYNNGVSNYSENLPF